MDNNTVEYNFNVKKLTDKRYVGILLSIVSVLVNIILNEIFDPKRKGIFDSDGNKRLVRYYIFKGIFNLIVSTIIVFSIKHFYGKSINEIFHIKNLTIGLISGIGILLSIIFYFIKLLSNLKESELTSGSYFGLLVVSLTTGLFQGIVIVLLMVKGYFYLEIDNLTFKDDFINNNSTIIFKYLYVTASALIYAILSAISNSELFVFKAFYSFFHYFALIFALSTVYILSRNILIPIIMAAVYDCVTRISMFCLAGGYFFGYTFSDKGDDIINFLMIIVAIAAIYVISKPKEPKETNEQSNNPVVLNVEQ